jgi:hypothetical protein
MRPCESRRRVKFGVEGEGEGVGGAMAVEMEKKVMAESRECGGASERWINAGAEVRIRVWGDSSVVEEAGVGEVDRQRVGGGAPRPWATGRAEGAELSGRGRPSGESRRGKTIRLVTRKTVRGVVGRKIKLIGQSYRSLTHHRSCVGRPSDNRH